MPSANLTPASGRQDHTTSPYAAIVFRPRAVDRSWIQKNPPCDPIARKTLPRPPHPCPTFVTIAKRPSAGRDGRINRAVSTKSRSGIFLQRGLDTPVRKTPDGQISCSARRAAQRSAIRRSPTQSSGLRLRLTRSTGYTHASLRNKWLFRNRIPRCGLIVLGARHDCTFRLGAGHDFKSGVEIDQCRCELLQDGDVALHFCGSVR